jgi:hypothetical protein
MAVLLQAVLVLERLKLAGEVKLCKCKWRIAVLVEYIAALQRLGAQVGSIDTYSCGKL